MKLYFSVLKQFFLIRFFMLVQRYLGQFWLFGEFDMYTLHIYGKRSLFLHLMSFLKYHWYSRVQQITDLVCIDRPDQCNRFELVYLCLSYNFNTRLAVHVLTPSTEPVPTLTLLFSGLNWQEREVWDMFGIAFLSHPDLRRLLTDYGFLGHPLRKDFPLSGFVEVAFDDTTQLVGYHALSLAQEFRDFGQLTNPWFFGNTRQVA